MFSNKKLELLSQDFEAAKILQDFLPLKIVDMHTHLLDTEHLPNIAKTLPERSVLDLERYKKEISPVLCNPESLKLNIIPFPDKAMADDNSDCMQKCDTFLIEQLNKDKENYGEIIVTPNCTVDSIKKRLVHKRIKGFKCYHLTADREVTWNASIGEYLPESAWQIANEKKMYITLHMVKDHALADRDNFEYIRTMAKKYPDAVLILAHAARSFAAWTGIEAVEKVADLENVWFDFSAVCESPAMIQIIKKAGISRCMWGSDYPVCRARGKAISLADTFYWIYQNDLDNFSSKTKVNNWIIGLENLFAVRQAAILTELGRKDIEDLFYNNAINLWKR